MYGRLYGDSKFSSSRAAGDASLSQNLGNDGEIFVTEFLKNIVDGSRGLGAGLAGQCPQRENRVDRVLLLVGHLSASYQLPLGFVYSPRGPATSGGVLLKITRVPDSVEACRQ
jgi:hypothetical protein